jgi:hypothetical protein
MYTFYCQRHGNICWYRIRISYPSIEAPSRSYLWWSSDVTGSCINGDYVTGSHRKRQETKQIYRLILRTNENWSYSKTEPIKIFDSSNQSEKNPALVCFKFKIHHFLNNSRNDRDVLLTIPCIIGYSSSTF